MLVIQRFCHLCMHVTDTHLSLHCSSSTVWAEQRAQVHRGRLGPQLQAPRLQGGGTSEVVKSVIDFYSVCACWQPCECPAGRLYEIITRLGSAQIVGREKERMSGM